MKKLLFASMLLGSVIAFAQTWTVHTTCGKTVTLTTADNVGVEDLKNYVRLTNYGVCGSYPSSVIVQL
ncbi:hypothetical protein [uncultured Chryseobacterium sp.]|jgi:hypothetical protein|uniref:hypothetical protein n=1 Tax=uncultured Chryseobacterium sp. TaxID=259322 RepID=UPI00261B5978|nr:hypothetical protein [uncultured Chryseobacterium sp.]